MSAEDTLELPDELKAELRREFQSRSVGNLHDESGAATKEMGFHRIPGTLRKAGISLRGGPGLPQICKELGIRAGGRVSW